MIAAQHLNEPILDFFMPRRLEVVLYLIRQLYICNILTCDQQHFSGNKSNIKQIIDILLTQFVNDLLY